MHRADGGHRDAVERLVLGALLALLAWSTVPLGSNRPWSSALLGAGVGVLVAIWALAALARSRPLPPLLERHRAALLMLAGWVAFTLVQALPAGEAVLGALAPASARDYGAALAAGASPTPAISVDRSATLHALVRHAALAGIVVLALALLDSRRRLRAVLIALTAVGTAQAAYGIAAALGAEQVGLWRPGEAAGGVSGTYVNRNHLAGLLELAIPAGVALLWLEHERVERRAGLRGRLLAVADLLLGPGVIVAFALLVMTAALVLTGSRGGLAGFAAGVVLAVLIGSAGRAGWRTLAARLAMLALLPLAAVAWMGADALVGKLSTVGLASDRGALRAAAYEIIGDRPVTGAGAGTFRWVFPAYKDASLGTGSYEHLHSDPLELIVEQGAVGAVLAGGGVLALLAAAVRGARRRHDPTLRACLFAALAGVLALLVHGLVDFNLQIPANAAWWFTALALGAAAAGAPHRER